MKQEAMIKKTIAIGLFMCLFCVIAFAQNNFQLGSLNIRNYPSTEYNGQTQIFSITQDQNGIMYFGNKTGVLLYDGRKWETIKVLNEKNDSYEVNSLAASPEGVIYVGARGDFGYLESDARGKAHFVSIASQLDKDTDLKNPRAIKVTNDGVFFHYGDVIYQYKNKKLKAWKSPEKDAYYGMFYADGKIYAARSVTGLYSLENGGFKLVPNGGKYNSGEKIYSILNFNNGTYLQTTEGNITNISDPFHPRTLMLENIKPAYNAINVFDQYFSSGSFSDGLLVYDRNFRLIYRIDIGTGLIDNNINCQYLDREGNIWVGTNKGISKIDIISPVSRFGINFGMTSGVEGICEFKGIKYFATLSGVYYLNDQQGDHAERIKKVNGLNIDCYGLKTVAFDKDTVLLVAANNGVWMLREKFGALTLVSKCGPYNFAQSPKDQNLVFVANYDGLSSIRWNGAGFTDEGYISGFSEDIFNINVQPDGALWLGTISSGIIKAHVSTVKTKGRLATIGSGKDGAHYITLIDGVPLAGNDNGLFEIRGNQLMPSKIYNFPKKGSVHRLLKDASGRLWAILVHDNTHYEIGFFENNAQHFWNSIDFVRFSADIVHGLFDDRGRSIWLGGPNGLMVYNPDIKKDYNPGFSCFLRQLTWSDSVLYSGIRLSKGQKINLPEIQYSSKEISFEAAATTFFDEEGTEFSFKLDGQDEEWTSWSTNNKKSYTNLKEGTYSLHIKARNIYGFESDIATYTFTILPPWYRTIWAYIIYIMIGIVLYYFSVKFANRRIRKQKEHLEEVVKERTAEIVEQKIEIEKQKEIVEEKNKDIMDSIRYAKRLQDAILPTSEYISSCFKESFVLFKPKDIVSGDFYWVHKVDHLVYFAVVDCTGHGVPGAFVSIVGNNGLNRAIKEFNLVDPAEILNKLTILVEDAFRQQGYSEVRDGMDIALCCLDTQTGELTYSGANNPIYILSGEDLGEIKADKQPIGHFEDRKPFTTHTVQLQPNDTVILFSDGFADQFGGPNGKKYKYTKMKAFLVEHSNEPLQQMGEQMKSEFENWSEGFDQIDDVCVMGIRY